MRPQINGELERRINNLLDYTGAQSAAELVREATREKVREIEQHQMDISKGEIHVETQQHPLPYPENQNGCLPIGYPIIDGDTHDEPFEIPLTALKGHYARIGAPGNGRRPAFIDDALHLYQNTTGPVILINPGNEQLSRDFMQAFYCEVGEEEFRETVNHFPISEITPEIGFFDIRPDLEHGKSRDEAIQTRVELYEDIHHGTIVDYDPGKSVASRVIRNLIKALYDEQYADQMITEGEDHPLITEDIPERNSINAFSHKHLEQLGDHLYTAEGAGNENNHRLSDISDQRIRTDLRRQTVDQNDTNTHMILDGVFNKFNYIRKDVHTRRLFDRQTTEFDFAEHLTDDEILLFDIDGQREASTAIQASALIAQLMTALRYRQRSQDHNVDSNTYVVNILLDHTEKVLSHQLLEQVLSYGKSYDYSLGLGFEYLDDGSNGRHSNNLIPLLPLIDTLLFTQSTISGGTLNYLSNGTIDADDLRTRVSQLPQGEWVPQLPPRLLSEERGKTLQLRLAPLPTPSGHPDSDSPLGEKDRQQLSQDLDQIHNRLKQQYTT